MEVIVKIEREDNKIIINEKEYEIISYVKNENGNYLVYTDGKVLENNNIALYVNLVVIENGEITLESIDDDEVSGVIEIMKERLK